MRLFIAFTIPEHLLTPLQPLLASKGITPTHHFHCTLKFLGETPPHLVPHIQEFLTTLHFPPITAHLTVPGAFPSTKKPRVLWVGIHPKKDITALQHSIDALLKKHFAPTPHFTPHVTLARIKPFTPQNKLHAFLKASINQKPFTITHVHLYESTLTLQGPHYTRITSYPSSYS